MNTLKLSPKRSGEPITAVEWNRLVEELRRLKVVGGVGIRIHETTLGTIISSDARPQRASRPQDSIPGPWTMTLDEDASTHNTLLFSIQPGTLNGTSADVLAGGTPLSDPTARLSINVAGTHKVWLKIKRLSGGATLVDPDDGGEISWGVALPADDENNKYVELATITVTGAGTTSDPFVASIQQTQFNNIGYKACLSEGYPNVSDHTIWGV